MRLAGGAVLLALFALACHLWRRGYRDEAAAEREWQKVAIRWLGEADPFYDDDGDGLEGTAA